MKPSKSAKAELTTLIAQDRAAQQAQDTSPIQTKAAIRGYWAQCPATCRLFGVIVTTWRKSTARRPGHGGHWAAHPYQWWCDLCGMSDRTLKRHLNELEANGLIERERGRHGGNRVLSFIRPTRLALTLSKTREGDWEHLGHTLEICETEPPKPKPPAKPSKPEHVKATPEEMAEIMAEDNVILKPNTGPV